MYVGMSHGKKCIIKHGTRAEAPAATAAAVRRRVARGAIFIYVSANRQKKTIIRLKTHTHKQQPTERATTLTDDLKKLYSSG